MINVLTHTTALEAMRLARFPRALARSEALDAVPGKAPAKAEAKLWAESDPLLRALSRPLDILVADPAGSRSNEVFRAHALSRELPEGALLRISENVAVVAPEILVLQMARVATPLELVMLIDELCGLYAIRPSDAVGMAQRETPIVELAALSDFAESLHNVPAASKLRRACKLAIPLSGSPMESKLAARISWSRRDGGYCIPILSMNQGLEVQRISRNLGAAHVRKPDILFSLPNGNTPGFCLDYHGRVHSEEGRAEADSVRANELLAFGLQPFSIWHAQYQSTAYMDRLLDGVIRSRLGLPRHRTAKERQSLELARREALLTELDVIDGVHWGVSELDPAAIKARESVEEARDLLSWVERRGR